MPSPNLSDSARRTAREVRDETEDFKAAARKNAGAVVHSAQQFGADVKHAVQDQLHNLQETASDYMDQGKSKAAEMRHSLENRIRRQPLNSMLIVAGIGFALGFLFTRR